MDWGWTRWSWWSFPNLNDSTTPSYATWVTALGKMILQRMLRSDTARNCVLPVCQGGREPRAWKQPSCCASRQLPSVTYSCSAYLILSGRLLRRGVWRSCGYASGALIRCLDAFWKWLLRNCLIAIPHIQSVVFCVFFFSPSWQGSGMPWIAKYTFLLQILGRKLCTESRQAVSSNVNKLIGVAFPVQSLCPFLFFFSFKHSPPQRKT